jgi:hypothetical protein
MNRITIISGIFRDFGIFFLGVASICVAVDYIFLHPDPMRQIQTEMQKSFMQTFQQSLRDGIEKSDTHGKKTGEGRETGTELKPGRS